MLEQERAATAKRSLIEYVSQIEVPGAPISDDPDEEVFYAGSVKPAAHHRLLLEKLQALADGKLERQCKRMMVFMPPGSAKSTYASVCFTTWYLGRSRNKNIIFASYGSDLARKFGRKCRQVVKSDAFNKIFNTSLSPESSAADEWSLLSGCEYMAGGILSGMTGNRADGLLIDDPVKGRAEADSEIIQVRTWDAYKDDLRTRLKPHGWQLIIQTRWNENDLSGQILPENWKGESGLIKGRDGYDWYVICLPAECQRDDDPLGREIGEFLWTDWFVQSDLEVIKDRDLRTWSALYQQQPAPEEGIFFKREWFNWYDEPPKRLYRYGASDYAVTDEGGDYTVHVVAGLDENQNVYVLDLWRKQSTSDVWIDGFLDLVDQHDPLMWAEEQGQIIKSVGPFIERRMNERSTYCAREQFTSTRDKPTRARSFQAMAATGKIYLPRDATWSHTLMNELLTFPAGKYDDIVDGLSLLCRMLSDMVGAAPKAPEKPKEDRWETAFDKADRIEGTWRT